MLGNRSFILRIFIVTIGFLTIISGCSFRNLVVEHIDWLIVHEIDDYFDLTKEQEDLVRKKVVTQIKWIQIHMIPVIRDHLTRLAGLISSPMSEDNLVLYAKTIPRELWLELIDHIADDSAQILTTLKEDQWHELEEHLADRQAKKRALANTSDANFAAAFAEYQKSHIDSMSKLTGPLKSEQAQALRNASFIDKRTLESDLAQVELAQQDFIREAKKIHDPHAMAEFLKNWVQNPGSTDPHGYAAYRDARTARLINELKILNQSLNSDQRAHLSKKIHEFLADLELLRKTSF